MASFVNVVESVAVVVGIVIVAWMLFPDPPDGDSRREPCCSCCRCFDSHRSERRR